MMEDERLKEVSKELIKEKNMKQGRITYLVGSHPLAASGQLFMPL